MRCIVHATARRGRANSAVQPMAEIPSEIANATEWKPNIESSTRAIITAPDRHLQRLAALARPVPRALRVLRCAR